MGPGGWEERMRPFVVYAWDGIEGPGSIRHQFSHLDGFPTPVEHHPRK